MSAVNLVADYTALRAYAGSDDAVLVEDVKLSGIFVYDAADTTTADNGGTVIVITSGARSSHRFKRRFNGNIRPEWFGADPSGASDASSALSAAAAVGPLTIGATSTFRVSANLSLSADITVETGGSFSIDSTKVLTIAGDLTILGQAQVFAGSGSVALGTANQQVVSTWFGGSSSDWSPGIQKALEAGARIVDTPAENGTFNSQITVPANIRASVRINGNSNTVANSLVLFKYERPQASNQGSVLTIDLMQGLLVENSLSQTSVVAQCLGSAISSGVSIAFSGTTATVTTPVAHNFPVGTTGQFIKVDYANQAPANGYFQVASVLSSTQFTYTMASAPGVGSATGNINLSGFETAVYDDNHFTLRNGEVRGFYRVAMTQYCGYKTSDIVARFNGIVHEFGRGSSFVTVEDYLGVNNVAFIYYNDPVPNALSTGLELNNCASVLASGGVGVTADIFVKGVQVVSGQGNSVDLCSVGGYCVYLNQCQNSNLSFDWCASDLGASASHRGICLEDCFANNINVGSFQNHLVCYEERTNAASSLRGGLNNTWTANKLKFGTCQGQTDCVCLWFDIVGSTVEGGFAVLTASPRSSTNYEFYATGANCAYIHVFQGMQKGFSYSQPSLGSNSSVDSPIMSGSY